MDAEKKGITFSENIAKSPIVNKYLSSEQILQSLEPNNYIGHSHEIIDRVLSSIND